MKKFTAIILTLITILLAGCLTSCSGNNKNQPTENNIENNVISDKKTKSETKNSPTLVKIENTGEIPYNLFSMKLYKSPHGIGDYGECLDTELFPYCHDKLWGYADKTGKIVIKEQYDWAGCFSENKAFVEKDGKCYVIDTSGNVLYTMPDSIPGFDFGTSSDGTKAKPKWDGGIFQNGKAIFIFSLANGNYARGVAILTDDFKLSTFIIDNGTGFSSGISIINTPEFTGFVVTRNLGYPAMSYNIYDISGSVIWTLTVEDVRDIEKKENTNNYYSNFYNSERFNSRDGYIALPNAEWQWGLYNLAKKKFVIDCAYDYVDAPSDGLVAICRYGKWGYADLNGTIKIEPSFNFANEFHNGKALVLAEGNELKAIDKDGNITADYNISVQKASGCGFYSPSASSDYNIVAQHLGGFTIVDYSGNKLYSANADDYPCYFSDNYIFYNDTMFKITR